MQTLSLSLSLYISLSLSLSVSRENTITQTLSQTHPYTLPTLFPLSFTTHTQILHLTLHSDNLSHIYYLSLSLSLTHTLSLYLAIILFLYISFLRLARKISSVSCPTVPTRAGNPLSWKSSYDDVFLECFAFVFVRLFKFKRFGAKKSVHWCLRLSPIVRFGEEYCKQSKLIYLQQGFGGGSGGGGVVDGAGIAVVGWTVVVWETL